ncbi:MULTISPECIES: polysaccharide pyruvyl transferase family protein [unclassified Kaistella]|uniref:polysaccharide pyruvyl transferase family protein n=1 Tax=unclassified Kaistella TaxID=2762626 RepID=UPI002732883A|nr:MULTISPECIES: polysaccharide pyruvyl transferase family protein [unclassified Kaistella]MDP2452526.1 polysaccharide pyruvyl transferase family protein [Kaistella sp. SH11-4b]MDP2455434.1 polysaccharide pyruvyl transferase family protein [Kaistella sp. SH40-3]MDP2458338.1 polysaccharide pyruvyl transferase family protein [Kaistella sp. SH19-2b]
MFWYRHHEGHGNFGDELNPFIIERLSGKKVYYLDFNDFKLDSVTYIKTFTHRYLKRKISFANYVRHIYYYFIVRPVVLVAIGSVLEHITYNKCIVWGAGIIETKSKIQNADFRVVRGKYTQLRLKELGHKVPDVVGDPAILLPLIYKPEWSKKFKLGVIPHHRHYNKMRSISGEDMLVINLLDPIEKIINEICSCENTLSTSLHGIIVSHAYGIPSIWCTDHDKKLYGDDVKFRDYFSSVGLEEYKSIPSSLISTDLLENLKLIESVPVSQRLPQTQQLALTQISLLKAFPFVLNRKFEDIQIKFS